MEIEIRKTQETINNEVKEPEYTVCIDRKYGTPDSHWTKTDWLHNFREDEMQELVQKLSEKFSPNPMTNPIVEQKVAEFIQKFCNDHNGYVRFLRSVFYDEKDGAEQIISFLRHALTTALKEQRDLQLSREKHIMELLCPKCKQGCAEYVEKRNP